MKLTTTTATVFGSLALVAFGATACDTGAADSHPFTAKAQHGKATKDSSSKPDPMAGLSGAQKQAVGSAQDYLATGHFSEVGLIAQLSSKYGDGFTKSQAAFAVHHIKVNWSEQAVGSAKDYLSTGHFSRTGLINQLSSAYGDQFTKAQAIYAVNHVGL
jgi:hypothetical protein